MRTRRRIDSEGPPSVPTMTGSDTGGHPADTPHGSEPDTIGSLWQTLETGLSAYLATMVAPDGEDYLVLELTDLDSRGADGCTPYVEFISHGQDGTLLARVPADDQLREHHRLDGRGHSFLVDAGWRTTDEDPDCPQWSIQVPLGEVPGLARQVICMLREHFGIAHPQLLTYQAWGRAAGGVGVLELLATDEVPVDHAQTPDRRTADTSAPAMWNVAIATDNRDGLVELVANVLRQKYDEEPTIDDDDDFVLHQLATPVWVRVRTDQPTVEILACVAHLVASRRQAAIETELLNRDRMWSRWTVHDSMVWQTLRVPALPFVPAHLDAMLEIFFADLRETQDDLAYRIGARVD